MASFEQRILVTADTRQAARSVDALARQIQSVADVAGKALNDALIPKGVRNGAGNLAEALVPKRALTQLDKEIQTIVGRADTAAKRVARTIEGIGTVGVSAAAIDKIGKSLGELAVQAGQAQDAMANVNAVTQNLLPGFKPAQAAISTLSKSVSTLEYRFSSLVPGAEAITNAMQAIGGGAGAAGAALALALGTMETVLGQEVKKIGTEGTQALQGITDEVQSLLRSLADLNRQLGPTLSQLQELRSKGRNRLADNSPGSDAFRRGANTTAYADAAIVQTERLIEDAIRNAKGLRPQSVENRATNTYRTTQGAKQFRAEEQARLNSELAEYERLALEVADAVKAWADNLTRVERSSKAGVLGSTSQLQTRLQEFRDNRNSAQIIRDRSAALLGNPNAYAREAGPGGNTMTAQDQYRTKLNRDALAAESKTLQVRYSWLKALRDGAQIQEAITKAARQEAVAAAQAAAQRASDRKKEAYRRLERMRGNRNQRYEGLATGVGFSALFGAGPVSLAATAAGSFVGQGFGGQILGGALGQRVDDFLLATTELGRALLSVTDSFAALKEASLISSRAVEKQIERTADAGLAATANAAAQKDLATSVGTGGVKNLQRLGEAADLGSRQWAIAVARIQAAVAGPLGGISNRLAKGGQISNLNSRAGDLVRDLGNSGQAAAAKKLAAAANPLTSFGKSQDQVIAELQAAIKEAESKLPPLKIKLDPQQIRQELISTLEKQLESLNLLQSLRDQLKSRAREQQDLDQQRYDLVLQNERAVADLRRSIEERIGDTRLANIQRENDLLRAQGDIRAQSLRNQNIGLRNGFTNDQVSSAANSIADYLEQELQVANDAAAIKRDAALEVQRLDIETERFKLQVSQQVARLNEDSARRVADINKGVRRTNQDTDTRRFELEKQIAVLRLQSINAEAALGVQMAGSTGQQDLTKNLLALQQATANAIRYTETLKPPKALKEVAAVGVGGATTSGLDAVNARASELVGNIAAAKTALLDLISAGNWKQLEQTLLKTFQGPLNKSINDAQTLWDELSGNGTLTSGAAGRNAALVDLQEQITQLMGAAQGNPAIVALLKGIADQLPGLVALDAELSVSNEILQELNDTAAEVEDAFQALNSPMGGLTEVQKVINRLTREGINLESTYARTLLERAKAIDKLKTSLTEAEFRQKTLNDLVNQMGTTLNNALGGAIDNLINKTQSWQSVLSDVLGQIGSLLLSAGISLAGGNDGVGFFSFLSGNFGKRASGGPITAGQPYLTGEQGPELILPRQSGYVLNANETRAARGKGSPAREQLNTSAGASGGNTVLSFQTTQILGEEWIDRKQLEAAMAQTRVEAAREGAERGHRKTLDKLRQSPGTRRSLGM